jgi:hypothetical protein
LSVFLLCLDHTPTGCADINLAGCSSRRLARDQEQKQEMLSTRN